MLPFGLFICFFLNLDVYIISCFCGNVVYHQKSLHVLFYNQIHQRILQKSRLWGWLWWMHRNLHWLALPLKSRRRLWRKVRRQWISCWLRPRNIWSNLQTRRMNCSKTCAFDTIVTVNRFLEILHCSWSHLLKFLCSWVRSFQFWGNLWLRPYRKLLWNSRRCCCSMNYLEKLFWVRWPFRISCVKEPRWQQECKRNWLDAKLVWSPGKLMICNMITAHCIFEVSIGRLALVSSWRIPIFQY